METGRYSYIAAMYVFVRICMYLNLHKYCSQSITVIDRDYRSPSQLKVSVWNEKFRS